MSVNDEALALVELESVATGLACVDALTKRATVRIRGANVVEPGVYLLCFTGPLAEVEEAYDAAVLRADGALRDQLLLPYPDRRLFTALGGALTAEAEPEALAIIEGSRVAATLASCDRAVKYAEVALVGLRITPGLGGRAYFAVAGALHDVEAAVDEARDVLADACWRTEVIARPTPEVVQAVLSPGTFTFRGT